MHQKPGGAGPKWKSTELLCSTQSLYSTETAWLPTKDLVACGLWPHIQMLLIPGLNAQCPLKVG
ncbi:rCG64338 [Rattus norvegicus]|uniref:RCG64338 n=1 Tax=Rattus norvegicus TaxID=10116 RepID=A6HGC5_RAT|nr:rCG64338 [Rattus norvegicus]